LLIAHADIGDAGLDGGGGDRLYRKAHDAEHVIDALLFQTARHQLRAGDLGHFKPPRFF
jgi:hypothetical protein